MSYSIDPICRRELNANHQVRQISTRLAELKDHCNGTEKVIREQKELLNQLHQEQSAPEQRGRSIVDQEVSILNAFDAAEQYQAFQAMLSSGALYLQDVSDGSWRASDAESCGGGASVPVINGHRSMSDTVDQQVI